MSQLDDAAARALDVIENAQQPSDAEREAWSRFIFAQMLRSPTDVFQLLASVNQEALNMSQDQLKQLQIGILQSLLSHTQLVALISAMRWMVLALHDATDELLTSDWPLWATGTFAEPHAAIFLPIGPRRLFIASPDRRVLESVRSKDPDAIVSDSNAITVAHARKYVFGTSDTHKELVQATMGTKRHSTLAERLAAARGLPVVDQASPIARSVPQ